jgi:CDGSH-type Zn-finger protein
MDSINTARLQAFPSSDHGHCNIQEIQTDHDQHYPKGDLRIEIFSRKDCRVKDGPYIVSGNVPLAIQVITPNREGLSWDWKEGKNFETEHEYNLCRCDRSKTKPFCDGTHSKIRFDGTETATRRPYVRRAEVFKGPTLALRDAEDLCAFARFCDPGGKIWGLIEQTDNPDAKKLVIREANHCPAGRLVVTDNKTGKELEEKLPPSIGVVEDPALGCSGPLWVRGRITIESADGTPYELRNKVTLCRCGVSINKPFCNGSHASIKFKDGLVEFAKATPGQ